jgi:hypothetical protein
MKDGVPGAHEAQGLRRRGIKDNTLDSFEPVRVGSSEAL